MSPTRRLLTILGAIWIVCVVVGTVVFLVIQFPPVGASNVSQSIQDTIRLITLVGWPVFSLVVLALIGAVLVHQRDPGVSAGTATELRGRPRLAAAWVGVVTAIVLALAIVGTITLSNEEAAEALGLGGRGTSGGTNGGSPAAQNLEVQVIAQQWAFTFRYPSYGGMETAQLVLPEGANVTFHITSLDVTHAFWYPALGVKADAVPEHDNTFAVQPTKTGTYRIQCGELCGLWHGAMSDDNAMVVSASDFATWAQQQESLDAPIMKYLPPYSHTYVPNPGAYGS